MRCELDYSEGEACKSQPHFLALAGSRGKTVSGLELSPDAVDDHDFCWTCHALHAPQHAAASPFGPLTHNNDFLHTSCRSRLYIIGTGISRYAGFCVACISWQTNRYHVVRPCRHRRCRRQTFRFRSIIFAGMY